jgi:hypothetical protein
MLYKLRKYKSFITTRLKTDFKTWKLIGKGSIGWAYDMGDGRVCKITTSSAETRIAEKLKKSNNKYPYLYKILDVFFIDNKTTKFKFGLIVTPKYKKLTDKEKTDLYELFCFLDLSRRFKYQSIKQIRKKISKAAGDYYFVHQDVKLCDIIDKRMQIFKDYNILNMLRNLKSAHIGPQDMHYENILKDKDKYILIDIAC